MVHLEKQLPNQDQATPGLDKEACSVDTGYQLTAL